MPPINEGFGSGSSTRTEASLLNDQLQLPKHTSGADSRPVFVSFGLDSEGCRSWSQTLSLVPNCSLFKHEI